MNMKKFLKVAPTVLGVVGGIATQYATLMGAINPRAGAVLTGVALSCAALGESITKIKRAVKAVEGK